MSRYVIGGSGRRSGALGRLHGLLRAAAGAAGRRDPHQVPESGTGPRAGADRGDPRRLRRRRAALVEQYLHTLGELPHRQLRLFGAARRPRRPSCSPPTCRRHCGSPTLGFRAGRACSPWRSPSSSTLLAVRVAAPALQSVPSLFVSVPVFWLGIMLIQVFSFQLKLMPGHQSGPMAGPRSCRC